MNLMPIPTCRCKGFGPIRQSLQRRRGELGWWMWLDCVRSMKVEASEEILRIWYALGYSALNVWDAENEWKRTYGNS